jgi:hypothetical protein
MTELGVRIGFSTRCALRRSNVSEISLIYRLARFNQRISLSMCLHTHNQAQARQSQQRFRAHVVPLAVSAAVLTQAQFALLSARMQ